MKNDHKIIDLFDIWPNCMNDKVIQKEKFLRKISQVWDSNHRPSVCQAGTIAMSYGDTAKVNNIFYVLIQNRNIQMFFVVKVPSSKIWPFFPYVQWFKVQIFLWSKILLVNNFAFKYRNWPKIYIKIVKVNRFRSKMCAPSEELR